MLIDINANVGHWPFKQLRYNTCSALLERMNKFGVDISVIANLHGVFYKNTQSANEELYKEIKSNRRYRNRFIPFAIINPIYADWKYDFKVSCKKFGMKGLRLYPQYHDYDIMNHPCIDLVKMARDHGLPVAFSLRLVDKRERSWMDMDKEWNLTNIVPIVKAVPDAKYIILNVANRGKLSDEDIETFKRADITFDTSGRQSKVLEIIEKYGKDKVAFGTHTPILDYLTGRIRVEALYEEEADDETKELIRSGNARRILGI
jgi:predicted TIM-barrel fold metal-dependent hydrolase